MIELTEREIMSNWDSGMPIEVSICCITYKQEKYISDAIDGFLRQKTNFRFEIIIGEDCGGDGTLDIVNTYHEKYPNIIKVISRERNIGANSNLFDVLKSASGKYIAICEGDDYWLDSLKLSKQREVLEKNQNVDLCFHACQYVYPDGSTKIMNRHKGSKFFAVGDVIDGGGQFIPTASIFIRQRAVDILPEWFCLAKIGDYYIQVLSSLRGGACYIDDIMSIYRVCVGESWSSSVLDVYKLRQFVLSHVDELRLLDETLNFSYSQQIKKKISTSYSHLAIVLIKNNFFYDAFELSRKKLFSNFTWRLLVVFILSMTLYPFSKNCFMDK